MRTLTIAPPHAASVPRIGLTARDVVEDWNVGYALEGVVLALIEAGAAGTPVARGLALIDQVHCLLGAIRDNIGLVTLRRRDAGEPTLDVERVAAVFRLDPRAVLALAAVRGAVIERATAAIDIRTALAAVDDWRAARRMDATAWVIR